MTAEAVDYFSNHGLKLRFPWSLYHRPIVRELRDALLGSEGTHVLNVGSGPFIELCDLPCNGKRFTLCDIDARAIELAKRIHGSALAGADVVLPGAPLPYGDATFDVVISMDVVEHVSEPEPWMKEALRVLRPGGLLFLTTPNYASWSLRVLESTVLEAIARLQGFSRRDLHPTKLDAGKLGALLESAGARSESVRPIALAWVLAARARR